MESVPVTAAQTTALGALTAGGHGRIVGRIANSSWQTIAGHTLTVSWGLGGTDTVQDLGESTTFDLGAHSGTSTLTLSDPDAYPVTMPGLIVHTGHLMEIPPVTLTMYGKRKLAYHVHRY